MTPVNPVGEPIGAMIRRLRKERGLTQKTLAEKAKCSRSQIQQIESGTRVPQLSLRERLSSALGVALPATGRVTLPPGTADTGADALRMRFNVLLGRDPAVAERALQVAQTLIDAQAAGPELEPLRTIAVRQLDRAEDVLAQLPSHSVRVQEWNTVTDWCTVLGQVTASVRMTHVAGLAALGGEAGDEYHATLADLAARTGPAHLDIRRIYVLDSVTELWPYDERLWRLTRAGIQNLVVQRAHAPNAHGMLLVDNRFVVLGEYDNFRETRLSTRFSALPHDVDYHAERFERLHDLRRRGRAIAVNELLSAPPLSRFARLDEGDCREQFRAALAHAWNEISNN